MKAFANFKLLLSELWLLKKYAIVFFKGIIYSFRLTVCKSGIIKYKGFKIDTNNKFFDLSLRKMFLYQQYEWKELSILEKTIEINDKILEMGTGMGVTAMFAASIVGVKNVITFEVNPELIPVIKKNFELNGMNIHLEHKALVSDSEAGLKKKFYFDSDFLSGSALSNPLDKEIVYVDSERFLSVLEKEKPSYLIIDIEGEESELFKIKLPNCIKKICVEVHPFFENVGDNKISEVLKYLMQQGFCLELAKSIAFSLYLSRE
jgi:FkbM family methyltransferase